MTRLFRILHCSTQFAVASCLFLAASTLWARPNHDDWQTGTLVSQEPLFPADKKGQPDGCLLLPLTVYTVDASNYKYQFIGFPFSFSSGSAISAIIFRIDGYDDDVYVQDPTAKHLIKLKLFRKFPKRSGAESSALALNKNMKRRDWMTANISAVEPKFISPLALAMISLSLPQPNPTSPPLCSEDFIVGWKYVLQAKGSAYTFFWNRQNALDVTIHGANQFAFGNKGSAYLIDDNGKERKVQLAVTAKNP